MALFRQKTKPTSQFLENVTVTTIDGKPVLLSSLWKDKTVVLKILPRLGCRLCKYEARSLGNLRLTCDSSKVALAAVCFTDPDLDTFLSDGYWDWDIFLDPERQVYKKAQLYRLSTWQMMKDLMGRRIWAMSNYIQQKFAFPNSLRGDVHQLGGTFVIEQGGRVLFHFRPTKFAMYPSIKEIYTSLGGDPNDIEEPTPAEHVFSQEQTQLLYDERSKESHYSSSSTMTSF